MRTTVYLSGSSKHLRDEGKGWRKEFTDICNSCFPNIIPFDPTAHYDYSNIIPATTKECMNLFLNWVNKADICLVNLAETDKSVGTGIEVGYARALNKPIIGFDEDIATYEWVKEACDVVLPTMKDAIEYIALHYAF